MLTCIIDIAVESCLRKSDDCGTEKIYAPLLIKEAMLNITSKKIVAFKKYIYIYIVFELWIGLFCSFPLRQLPLL